MLKRIGRQVRQRCSETAYWLSPTAASILRQLPPAPASHPLLLISQISRSGGTLLSQLLDNHPQVLMHPHELKTGYPRKWDWPSLEGVRSAAEAFSRISEPKFARLVAGGFYSKGSETQLPIEFRYPLQANLFQRLAMKRRPTTDRAWFDLYFDVFFAAWIDHRRPAEPAYVGGFASLMALSEACMAGFRSTYPDGRLISIIREPVGWYRSVKRRVQVRKSLDVACVNGIRLYSGFEGAEDGYLQNCEAIERNRRAFGDRFMLIDFDDLVSRREATMIAVANWAGIDYSPTLLDQTFNGLPIAPNSSFSSEADREGALSEDDIERIRGGRMENAYRRVSTEKALV